MYRTKAKEVFKCLESSGFHVQDVEFLDGYFVFKHGKDTVVHFHIKELRGWKFGIWFQEDNENIKFDFFTQYERDIDKFKPSASSLMLEDLCGYSGVITELCEFIKKHPFKAWALDQEWHTIYSYDKLRGSFFRWLAYGIQYKRGEIDYRRANKRYLKIVNEIADACLVEPRIVDDNQGGLRCSPRYRIVCKGFKGEKLKRGHYCLEFDELNDKLQRKICKYEKWRNKFSYRKYMTSDIDLIDYANVVVSS